MKLRRGLFLLLIIAITLLAVSCTTETPSQSVTVWGENLVEYTPVVYTEEVDEAAGEFIQIVVDTFSITLGDCFSDTAKQTLTDKSIDILLELNVTQENALLIYSDMYQFFIKVKAIEIEKDEVWDSYQTRLMTPEIWAEYKAEYKAVHQQYYQQDMLIEYKNIFINTSTIIGADTIGKYFFKTVEQLFYILQTKDLVIFIPEVYDYLEDKQNQVNKVKTILESIGQDNFTTIFNLISTVLYYVLDIDASDNDNMGTVLENVKEENAAAVCAEIAKRVEKLALTQENWVIISELLIDIFPDFTSMEFKYIQLFNDGALTYLGQNMHSFILNASTAIKSINTNVLAYYLSDVSAEDNKYFINGEEAEYADYIIATAQKEIARYRLLEALNETVNVYFEDFFNVLYTYMEDACVTINLSVPQSYYENISNVSKEELAAYRIIVEEIDIESIDINNVESCISTINGYEDAVKGYYKIIAPMTFYYFDFNKIEG